MSFGNFNNGNKMTPMSEINTTPFVDVMLVLLIIFIVTAPLLTSAVPINLPNSKSVATPDSPDVVNLSINEKGKMFWNDLEINNKELPKFLSQAMIDSKGKTELHIRADRETKYFKITDIMNEAQKAGIVKLGFVNKVVEK